MMAAMGFPPPPRPFLRPPYPSTPPIAPFPHHSPPHQRWAGGCDGEWLDGTAKGDGERPSAPTFRPWKGMANGMDLPPPFGGRYLPSAVKIVRSVEFESTQIVWKTKGLPLTYDRKIKRPPIPSPKGLRMVCRLLRFLSLSDLLIRSPGIEPGNRD